MIGDVSDDPLAKLESDSDCDDVIEVHDSDSDWDKKVGLYLSYSQFTLVLHM